MGLQRGLIASTVIAGALSVAGVIAWAGSRGGVEIAGVPVMIVCAALAFGVQWLAFVPAYWKQTEHFYDLVGSLTYMLVTGVALAASRPNDARSIILGLLVFIWASRLGSFLFRRIWSAGSDTKVTSGTRPRRRCWSPVHRVDDARRDETWPNGGARLRFPDYERRRLSLSLP